MKTYESISKLRMSRTLFLHSLLLIAILPCSILLIGCNKCEDQPDLGSISISPAYGQNANTAISFSVSDYGGTESECDPGYTWDFGDGQTSSGKSATHVYSKTGVYVVKVDAKNEKGSDVISSSVTITDPDCDLYFWCNTTFYGVISVQLQGVGGYRNITVAYPTFPGCVKNQGNADFIDLPYGTYNFHAVSAYGMVWDGSVVLNDNCKSVLLN